jgi:hypothetical protein
LIVVVALGEPGTLVVCCAIAGDKANRAPASQMSKNFVRVFVCTAFAPIP